MLIHGTFKPVLLTLKIFRCILDSVLSRAPIVWLNKHFFHYFLLVGIHFCKADEPGDLPLAAGLVVSIQ